MTTILELTAVSKTYGEGAAEVHALRDIDLAVDDGELVAVMGPSGSGKSTLLTIAGTLEAATSGTVRVAGLDVAVPLQVATSAPTESGGRSVALLVRDVTTGVAVNMFGVPFAAAVGGWLLAGHEPSAVARQPLTT